MHGMAFLNGLLSNSILPRLSQPCKKSNGKSVAFFGNKGLLSQTYLWKNCRISKITTDLEFYLSFQ